MAGGAPRVERNEPGLPEKLRVSDVACPGENELLNRRTTGLARVTTGMASQK
jgi:hypothetical protein